VTLLVWIRPRTFLEELRTWLAWVERWVQRDGDGAHELEAIYGHPRRVLKALNAHLTLILVSFLTGSLTAGQATFNLTLNHLPSCFLRCQTLSKGRSFC
jgi:dynein light intermediate chain 1